MKRVTLPEVLSEEVVGVFIEALFPGGVGMSEEELGLELSIHGRGVHSEELGDTAHGVAFFPQNVNPDPVVVRELSVSHVCAPLSRRNFLSPWA